MKATGNWDEVKSLIENKVFSEIEVLDYIPGEEISSIGVIGSEYMEIRHISGKTYMNFNIPNSISKGLICKTSKLVSLGIAKARPDIRAKFLRSIASFPGGLSWKHTEKFAKLIDMCNLTYDVADNIHSISQITETIIACLKPEIKAFDLMKQFNLAVADLNGGENLVD